MTTRLPVSRAPGPLEAFAAHFDDLFSQRSQRQAFRDYLATLSQDIPSVYLHLRWQMTIIPARDST